MNDESAGPGPAGRLDPPMSHPIQTQTLSLARSAATTAVAAIVTVDVQTTMTGMTGTGTVLVITTVLDSLQSLTVRRVRELRQQQASHPLVRHALVLCRTPARTGSLAARSICVGGGR